MNAGATDPHAHALGKLARVLGASRAQQVLAEVLRALRLEKIATLDELHAVALALQSRTGFDATVGAMLAVDVAMMRLRAKTG